MEPVAIPRSAPAMLVVPLSPSGEMPMVCRSLLGFSRVSPADRNKILGSRAGSPRRAGPLVRFNPTPSTHAARDAPCHVSKGGPTGSTRFSSPVAAVEKRKLRASSPDAATARQEVLGSRQGTPRRCLPSLVRLKSADKSELAKGISVTPETKDCILGTRNGTPKRGRHLVRIASAEKGTLLKEVARSIQM